MKRQICIKILSGFLTCLLLVSGVFLPVRAETIQIPTPPPIPSAPPVPSAPAIPTAPTPPPVPSTPTAPSPSPAPSAPKFISSPTPVPTPPSAPKPPGTSPSPSPVINDIAASIDDSGGNQTGSAGGVGGSDTGSGSTTSSQDTPGNQSGNYTVGDPFIKTGDAYTIGTTINYLNTNADGSTLGSDDITIDNSDNGSNSTNSGSATVNNDDFTLQTNDGLLDNEANLASVSGGNSTSFNVGDSTVISGDATTTATAINVVNTNLAGVAVAEFNIDDTHTGDIVLSFLAVSGCGSTANCVTNESIAANNTQNGVNSNNTSQINVSDTSTVFQNNNADVVNNLVVTADTGNNQASNNTGGSSTVKTGDANVIATVGNFVNNNIAGDGRVMIGVVNIFGNLVGNIVLPQEAVVSPLSDTASAVSPLADGSITATNRDNGAGSTNTSTIDTSKTTIISQTNDVNIDNTLNVSATTGNNETSFNTASFNHAENVIETGDASIDVNAVNIANTNKTDGGTWWLVFVNDAAGNWLGKILGSPEGAKMGGSSGTQFTTTSDGAILVQNTGNGTGSTNNAVVSDTSATTVIQNNQANITNNLTLSANSGNNAASFNTGADNYIKTGNANVMANLVNFVNNNFIGSRVVVSIVNVFGSWLGSFVPPGYETSQIAPTSDAITSTSSVQETQNNSSTSPVGGSAAGQPAVTDSAQAILTTTIPEDSVVLDTSQEIAQVAGVSHEKYDTLKKETRGKVVEDNSITIPSENKRQMSLPVTRVQTLPRWFWNLFFTLVAIWVLKKIYVYVHNEKSYYQTSLNV